MKPSHSTCLSAIVRPRAVVESSMITGGHRCSAGSRISKAIARQKGCQRVEGWSRPCKPHRPQWVWASKIPEPVFLWLSRNDKLQFPHLGYINAPQRWPTREGEIRSQSASPLSVSFSIRRNRAVGNASRVQPPRSYFLLCPTSPAFPVSASSNTAVPEVLTEVLFEVHVYLTIWHFMPQMRRPDYCS